MDAIGAIEAQKNAVVLNLNESYELRSTDCSYKALIDDKVVEILRFHRKVLFASSIHSLGKGPLRRHLRYELVRDGSYFILNYLNWMFQSCSRSLF